MSTGKRMAALAALTLAAFVQPALAQDTAGAATTTRGINPTYHLGNLTCQAFITSSQTNLIEFKADLPSTKNPNPDPSLSNGSFNLEQGAVLTISNFDGKFFNFSITNGVVYYVFVKAGNGGSLFDYTGLSGAPGDTGLHGPMAPNGKYRDISHVSFCWQPENPGGQETAFARGSDSTTTTCLLNAGFGASRWGWTMGPFNAEFSQTWDVYAGAGQCDITKGRKVGTLAVSYVGTQLTLLFTPDSDVTLYENQVWVGSTPGPCKSSGCSKGYNPAPGQYNYDLSDSPITIETPFYVIFHAVVGY